MVEQTPEQIDNEHPQDAPVNLKSRLEASYDAIAKRYNDWTIPHTAERLRYLDKLLDHLPKQTSSITEAVSVLELGCGAGVPVTQKLLSYPNFSVVANDLSSVQLALARANLRIDPKADDSRLKLLPGDMLALDFEPAAFNAVVAMYSISHLPRSEQVDMLAKIAAWLKPGGWLLANFSAQESLGNEAQSWLDEKKGWVYWSSWGSEGTLAKVKEAGLEVVVQETLDDVVDDSVFLWMLARKSGS